MSVTQEDSSEPIPTTKGRRKSSRAVNAKSKDVLNEPETNETETTTTAATETELKKPTDTVKIQDRNENKGNINSSFVSKHFTSISIALGYIINTILYFTFINTLSMALDTILRFLLKFCEYDCNEMLIVLSIKIIIIMCLWYKKFTGGYDGDPLFQVYKYRLKLINKKEAFINFTCSIFGCLIYTLFTILLTKDTSNSHLSNIIVEQIQKKKLTKGKSFLTAFIYPKFPSVFKKFLMNIMIQSCPYKHIGNRSIDKIFMSNRELYSSVIMDFFLSEFICSFFNYVLLYLYVFTKATLPYSLETNLTFTQIVYLWGSKYSRIVGGPFMHANWILLESVKRGIKFQFMFFLLFSHFLGFALASLLFTSPRMSLFDAKNYFPNIDQEVLQKNIKRNDQVDVSEIPNEQVKESTKPDTYLGIFVNKMLVSYISQKEKTKLE